MSFSLAYLLGRKSIEDTSIILAGPPILAGLKKPIRFTFNKFGKSRPLDVGRPKRYSMECILTMIECDSKKKYTYSQWKEKAVLSGISETTFKRLVKEALLKSMVMKIDGYYYSNLSHQNAVNFIGISQLAEAISNINQTQTTS